MIKRILVVLIIGIIFSCKSVTVANETQVKTTRAIDLGSIGEDKNFVLEEDYNSTALPIFTTPIRINANSFEFNKTTFKAFNTANNKKNEPLNISYEDSEKSKPKFLKIEIADRVAVLNALNDKENTDVKNYISNKKDAHVITAISVVFDEGKMQSILNADAVFLEQNTDKTFVLKAYENSVVISILKINEGVVFAYQGSNFCWQENTTRQLQIMDIVEATDKCPNSTYRNSKRAKQNIDYFKF